MYVEFSRKRKGLIILHVLTLNAGRYFPNMNNASLKVCTLNICNPLLPDIAGGSQYLKLKNNRGLEWVVYI